MNKLLSVCMVCVLMGLALAQPEPAPPTAQPGAVESPATAPATKPTPGVLNLGDLKVDVKNRRIVIAAKVTAPTNALEFLLVRTGGKEYESLLHAKIKGSDLHAALLALNLATGKPARWVDDPMGGSARFMPPQGPAVSITLRWKDSEGKIVEKPASEWMAPAGQKQVAMPSKWIFVGSQFLPDGRYWADVEGEIISVSNFASAVLDVPFESSNKEALMDYMARAKAMPPAGTAVDMIIEPVAGEADSPHARVLLEIDPFGRLRLDGRAILLPELRDWADQFISKHPKGLVQIRAAGKAIVHDIEQVRLELKLGGAWDVDIINLPSETPVLPRTPDQLQRQLKWWDEQFETAKDLIRDPAEEAQATLQQIQQDLQVLKATQAMWEQYAKTLEDKTRQYKASTQPAGGSKPAPAGEK